jgi:hypothetical protein
MSTRGRRFGGAVVSFARAVVDIVGFLGDVVRQRTPPLRGMVAAAVAVTLAVTFLTAVTLTSSPGEAGSRGTGSVAASTPEASPPHQPLQSMAAAPQESPGPGSTRSPGSPGSPDDVDPLLPPSVIGDFVGWAIMDLNTGQITGSDNYAQLSTTASMIKAWLVADFLQQHGAVPDDPERLHQLSAMIRESHNQYTHDLFAELGGDESIQRLISRCGLTDAEAVPWYWSNTRLSPRDTARMGACLANGRAAGDAPGTGGRTDWLIEEMRNVEPWGAFGIPEAFPQGERDGIAVKNGWVIRSATDEYHVSCMAFGDGWSMGVLTRFPAELGYLHGGEICRQLAEEHLR